MGNRNHRLGATGEGGKLQCDEGSQEEFTEVHDYLKFPFVDGPLFPAGIAVRDRNYCLGATSEGGKLQCDEGSEEEFTEVHDYLKFLSLMDHYFPQG